MTLPTDLTNRNQPPAHFTTLFMSRLGGIAGVLGVTLALAQGFRLVPPGSMSDKVLQILPNLLITLWFIGIYAFQSSRLNRLGSLGVGAVAVGLLAIIGFNLIQRAAAANPESWARAFLESPAISPVFTIIALSFVWGILGLGVSSLQSGMIPRGAVAMWMVGIGTALTTEWLPIKLIGVAGILWSSVILLRGVPRKIDGEAPSEQPAEPAREAGGTVLGRFLPLDALRGVIMILMAIDHASVFIRHWHPFETWDQPLPDYPSLAAMLTRLATHPCAPGFFFLMGAGMILFAHARRQLGWSERKIASHLALRGLLFIVLEQLIVDLATARQPAPFEFSILAGLGAAMLLGILFLRLSGVLQAVAGVAIILIMQFLPGVILGANLGAFNPVRLLILPGSVGAAYALYPPVPWLGVALLGMAFARLLLQRQEKAYRLAGIAGLVCLTLFPLVRLMGGFGNLRMPPGNTLVDFLNVVKYPPSLSFLLLSLGFDLVVLYLFSKASSKLVTWGRPVVILGQAALYFFLVHWFIYAAMGMAWMVPGSLPQTYLAWVVGLILLYPVCKSFEAFKHKMPANSVWRML